MVFATLATHAVMCDGSPMDEITFQRNRVQAFVNSGKISKRDLAALAGLRDTVLIRARDDDWNPTARVLAALVMAIDKYEHDVAKKKARDELKRQVAA